MFGGYRPEAPHADLIGRIAERLASRVPRNATPRGAAPVLCDPLFGPFQYPSDHGRPDRAVEGARHGPPGPSRWPMGGHPGKAGRQRDHPPARRAGRTARPRGFGQCRHERPPGQPASGLSQVLPVYVRTTDETDDICIRFSPPLLRRAEIMPEAGLRTLRRTAECSGRGRRAGRTRRSPLSF